jgi:hypothetical protein
MKGRAGNWHQAFYALPLKEQLKRAVALNFCGIFVDRFGYEDGGESLRMQLEAETGVQALREHERFYFISLNQLRRDERN